jgi:polyphosphate kinase
VKQPQLPFKHRDISWLAFNGRVLQEAADRRNPLYERIKFMAIFSSNLDEFYRVRVASVRALLEIKKKTAKKLDFEPEQLLKRLLKVVSVQQAEFGELFRNVIRKELGRNRITLANESQLTAAQKSTVMEYFTSTVVPLLEPVFLSGDRNPPFLENRALHLVVRLSKKPPEEATEKERNEDLTQYVFLEIPAGRLPRFYVLPGEGKKHVVMFLDDVIRLGLESFFPRHDVKGAHSVKLTRDAELYIDDEYSGDLVGKIVKALQKRKEGPPSRFLYDQDMPKKTLAFLVKYFNLVNDELVPGGRYHNFHDLFGFPNPRAPELMDEPWQAASATAGFGEIRRRDILLYYPYHAYAPVIDFLSEAADDPAVTAIDITLYRVAKDSQVVEQLVRAAHGGKKVTAFVELKARFDEESNIRWAGEMQKAGARVFYSFPDLKVHAKMCLVSRMENEKAVTFGYLSTGNFNEKAALQYTDFGLFTADPRLTGEMQRVFNILKRKKDHGEFEHLLVAPYNLRQRLEALIDAEIKRAKKGEPAGIIAKMNSLEDRRMITRLYEAGEAGVKISLIVRGICCLVPGVRGVSRNIEVVSIVDRFLEHPRAYIFHNGGDELVYLSSADWMKRNLAHRIEVAFPVHDPGLKNTVRSVIDLQLADTVKARVVNKAQDNRYRKGSPEVRSQVAIRDLFA